MKLNTLQMSVVLSVLVTIANSCVNHIYEENKYTVGTTPLRFTASIKSSPVTRVTNNQFEEGDSAGLFVCIQPDGITGDRYADNMRFNYSTFNHEFIAEKGLFYPEGDVLLNLISYYPYQVNGPEKGKSTIPVAIKKSQVETSDYSKSDFLVSQVSGVKSSTSLDLLYEHKFSRVKITMVAAPGVNGSILKGKQPSISIGGFHTKAVYDFIDDTFTDLSEQTTIRPYGTWEWDEKVQGLTGKEMILIPQQILPSEQMITIELDGRIYYSTIPSNMKLLSGKQCELEINFQPSSEQLLSQIQGSIKDWDGSDKFQSESGSKTTYVDVSNLSFEQSNIYNVVSNGHKVAEVCKEYLLADNIDSQAIVVYPMVNGDVTDLNEGVVMQILGSNENKTGGKASWDRVTNMLTYSEGSGQAQSRFWITADGKISLSNVPDAVSVSVNNDMVREVRGEKTQFYPVVKIGTQYWMRDNLKATTYNNGAAIPKLTSMKAGATGYLLSQGMGNYYFYTLDMATMDKLLPTNWQIPTQKNWELLTSYLRGDAAVLKSGTWIPVKNATEVVPYNNKSDFNAVPVGMYVGVYQSDYEGRYVSYWTLDNSGTSIAAKNFWLESNTNDMSEGSVTPEKAYAIRCIHK